MCDPSPLASDFGNALWSALFAVPSLPIPMPLHRLFAPYSEGFRLAAEHGPRSEIVFEYACDNRAQGHGRLGSWLDRIFLRSAAARALRRRIDVKKRILGALISERQRATAAPITVLDIAAGTGRHVRELVLEGYGGAFRFVCHDRDPRKVMQGREWVDRDGLENILFAVGDATDPASYLIVDEPQVILAWGLFPRLLRDDGVRTVLRLVFEHLAPGGSFACTTSRARDGASSRWHNPLVRRTVDRDPTLVAGWLRATGFSDPELITNPVGVPVLLATKPEAV